MRLRTARTPADGLRLWPGPAEDGLIAAPRIPDCSVADEDGAVRSEFVWAALDCPGAFAVHLESFCAAETGR